MYLNKIYIGSLKYQNDHIIILNIQLYMALNNDIDTRHILIG